MDTLLGEPAVERSHERGGCRVWTPTDDLVVSRVWGHMVLDQAKAIMAAVDAALPEARGRLCVVHDWTEIRTYEVQVHANMSAWSLRVVRDLARVCVATTSPFVSLAVRTVNMAVQNRFELMTSADEAKAVVTQILAGRRVAPTRRASPAT